MLPTVPHGKRRGYCPVDTDIGTYTAQRNSEVLARYRRVAAEVAGS
jgi:hypothetical protein